ncbi:Brix domain-containing protein [Umbelopsis sp. PMI_123]|nr:Brix domain-containing protein [Umbelopsis sp. PMI_123]
MLRTIKPKNARSKRVLKNRESKVEENGKTAIFVRGSQTSQIVNDALKDLYLLKKPDAVNFTKKNQIHPFEDDSSLEFFSQKNDASLIVVGTHSKKRPHNLVFARMFDHQIMDMMELGIESATAMSQTKGSKCAVGMKPLMVFNGELFDTNENYKNLKNLFTDFFHGQSIDAINLTGLEHVITVTAAPLEGKNAGLIYFRVYTIQLKKSGAKTPRIELEEMGPSLDFKMRRIQLPKSEIWKVATKVPKELKQKKVKNVEKDEMGDVFGRIHLGNQNLEKIQTRKMKGLKKRGTEDDEDDDSEPSKRARVDEDEE